MAVRERKRTTSFDWDVISNLPKSLKCHIAPDEGQAACREVFMFGRMAYFASMEPM
jgi:hypothetical protein